MGAGHMGMEQVEPDQAIAAVEWSRRSPTQGTLSRRSLLNGAGALALSLGLTSYGLGSQANAYAAPLDRAPGPSAGRRFALLVGLNQYSPRATDCPPLLGCHQDLLLQKQLLVQRFGFDPKDILLLRDEQATVAGFQQALQTHLLAQVGPADNVVFHFSGYGSRDRWIEEQPSSPETQSLTSLILYDSRVGPVNRDWPESLLWEILSQLPTDRIVAVLDTGFVPTTVSLQGLDDQPNVPLGWHSRTSPVTDAPLDGTTLATLQAPFQAPPRPDWNRWVRRWTERFPPSSDALTNTLGDAPPDSSAAQPFRGVILRAQDWASEVIERPYGGTWAGQFTLGLTQQLWQGQPQTLRWADLGAVSLPRRDRTAHPLNSTLAEWGLSAPGSTLVTGDGVILGRNADGSLQLWLGGMSTVALAQCDRGTILRLETPQPTDAAAPTPANPAPNAPLLQITQRTGWKATAQILPFRSSPTAASPGIPRSSTESITLSPSTPPPPPATNPFQPPVSPLGESRPDPQMNLGAGQLVREAVRLLPSTPTLAIALDERLSRIERVDATSAFAGMAGVTIVGAEDSADYWFGPVQANHPTIVATLPRDPNAGAIADVNPSMDLPRTQYALLKASADLLPGCLGSRDEAIKTVIQHLTPHLDHLRALKLLRALENTAAALAFEWQIWQGTSNNSDPLTAPGLLLSQGKTSRSPGPTPGSLSSSLSGPSSGLSIGPTSGPGPSSLPLVPSPLALPLGQPLAYQVTNRSDRPLYLYALSLDPSGDLAIALPSTSPPPTIPTFTPTPPTQALLPHSQQRGHWPVPTLRGQGDWYLLAAPTPLPQLQRWLTLGIDARSRRTQGTLDQPAALVNALLHDLQSLQSPAIARGPAKSSPNPDHNPPEHWTLDVSTWTLVRLAYVV